MKIDFRFTIGVLMILLMNGSLNAQIWTIYECEAVKYIFSPLTNSTVIPPQLFLNFSGAIDQDDGVAADIPLGFIIDYNGNSYSTVNVCVNGWVSVGRQQIPAETNNNTFLFQANPPNNILAPLWGDHYYRTLNDKGFKPTKISYTTVTFPDPNPNAFPGLLHQFILEWKDLNINNKNDTNSGATFQLVINENPLAHDQTKPDLRASIVFIYDTLTVSAIGKTHGCSIGINDSLGLSYENGLFSDKFTNKDSIRMSKKLTTDCWPPSTCSVLLSGIAFTPYSSSSSVLSSNESATILSQNYPNPFTKSTTISLTISKRIFATLKIYDALGNQVALLVSKTFEPGRYAIPFDGSGLPDGMYFCKLEANGSSEALEMILLR